MSRKQNKTCLTCTGGPREGRAGYLGGGGPSVGGQDVLQLPGDHRDDDHADVDHHHDDDEDVVEDK